MQSNSILVRIMFPLVVIVAFILIATLFLTESFLKQTVEDVYIKAEVNHLKSEVSNKVDHHLMQTIRDSLMVATCPDTAAFLKTTHAKNGGLTKDMQKKLQFFKKAYNLETIYVTELETKNYFNETGFVEVIDLNDTDSEWFLQTLYGQEAYTVNVDSFLTGELTIWVDAIVNDSNKTIGLAGGGVKISNILEPIKSVIDSIHANAFLIDDAQIIRASLGAGYVLDESIKQLKQDQKKYDALAKALYEKQELISYKVKNSVHYLVLIPIDSLKWNIVVDFPATVFLEPLSGVLSRIFTSGILILVSILLFGWVAFSYMVARPLKKISLELENYDFHSDFNLQGCRGMGYEVDTICKAFQKSASLLRQTLQDYRESEELLRNVTNATDDLLFYKDKEGLYIGCNRAYEKWMGKTASEIIGSLDMDLYPKEIAKKHYDADAFVLENKKPVLIEEELENSEGKKVYLHINKSPLWDKNGEINGIVGLARDITHIKLLEKELRELNINLEQKVDEKTHALQASIEDLKKLNIALKTAKQKAQHAAQARSNFISSISHELRTPMNAIINFTDQILEDFDEILEDKELQEESKHYLERVLVNAKHLLHLINELLDFTKAESGKIDYDIQKYNINEIIDSAYTNTYSLLISSKIEYRIACSEEPLFCMVDSRRLLQILLNLLSNAIKFTKEGFIEIRSFTQNDDVIIEVEDSGRGIASDKIELIFDPFVQANRDDSGTGLGLGLAKRMSDDLGIALTVESQLNKGTTFSLRLKKA